MRAELVTSCGWVIRPRAVRRQKTDRRDAEHLLDLLLSKRFPRIWIPSPEERDVRQLLKHRDKLVRMQTSLNQKRGLRPRFG